MKSLEGQTALVAGGGTAFGRAIALALSARGVRIVVTGRDERALGVTVGEVVHGGGKARHLAGDVRESAHLAAAFARAREVFGSLDIIVIAELVDADCILEAVASGGGQPVSGMTSDEGPARILLAGVGAAGEAAARVVRAAPAIARAGGTCNALVVTEPSLEEDAAEDVAALAVLLCSRAGARVTGQTFEVGPAPPRRFALADKKSF